jgi:hypothetical protein
MSVNVFDALLGKQVVNLALSVRVFNFVVLQDGVGWCHPVNLRCHSPENFR